MNTDIKSLIPSMHAELKHMQSRVAELQVSLQQGSSDEKTIREENSRMNLRGIWTQNKNSYINLAVSYKNHIITDKKRRYNYEYNYNR